MQRDFGDKRVFSERRRNDSYAEEEPEWFSGGPTSQSETIELIGFDDKILEDDKRRSKRSRRRTESLKEGMLNTNVKRQFNLKIIAVHGQPVFYLYNLPVVGLLCFGIPSVRRILSRSGMAPNPGCVGPMPFQLDGAAIYLRIGTLFFFFK